MVMSFLVSSINISRVLTGCWFTVVPKFSKRREYAQKETNMAISWILVDGKKSVFVLH